MKPIEKNIRVYDEHGREYEATWPKRARGLVKNGRARFVSAHEICLACPPKQRLEDGIMSMHDKVPTEVEVSAVLPAPDAQAKPGTDEKGLPTIGYILSQIDKILTNTQYMNDVIEKLGLMDDGEAGSAHSPGNIMGQAKAEALGTVVQCRETTNQQLLRFYEKLYDDVKQKSLSVN